MWRVREREELGLIPRFFAKTSGWRGLEVGPDPGLLTHKGLGGAALLSGLCPVKEQLRKK